MIPQETGITKYLAHHIQDERKATIIKAMLEGRPLSEVSQVWEIIALSLDSDFLHEVNKISAGSAEILINLVGIPEVIKIMSEGDAKEKIAAYRALRETIKLPRRTKKVESAADQEIAKLRAIR